MAVFYQSFRDKGISSDANCAGCAETGQARRKFQAIDENWQRDKENCPKNHHHAGRGFSFFAAWSNCRACSNPAC
ncbi:hypothetical protein C0081_21590 [Cohaesibacter celericrescens]|jgi:hypothetical protein|uniref:Uncharacterized protein n=1 Tax=Cohaesibacter celericrescens TaxID=2067669 RepID=A0A2N5XKE7_9HYPH|nr:hypothetical protein C0081_21590 [Cohaesibacter celericrescens]